jgi:protein SCO1/2
MDAIRLRTVAVAAGLLAALSVVGALAWVARGGGDAEPGPISLEQLGEYGAVPPFALTERSGRRVTRDDLRGFVWVADFIYTECTETCPTQSLRLAQLQDAFPDNAPLRLVSITVDPEHDTPAVLRRYAERYRAADRWWFLTGDKNTIYCLARDGFRLGVVDPNARGEPDCRRRLGLGPARAWASHGSGGLIMHSARLVLVDGRAQIRAYHLATDPDSLARLRANLRRLLGQAAPPPRASPGAGSSRASDAAGS